MKKTILIIVIAAVVVIGGFFAVRGIIESNTKNDPEPTKEAVIETTEAGKSEEETEEDESGYMGEEFVIELNDHQAVGGF